MARVNWKLHLKILVALIFMILAFAGVALGKNDNYTIQDTSTKVEDGFNHISDAHVVGSPFTIYIYATGSNGKYIDPSTNATVTVTLSRNNINQNYTVNIVNGVGSQAIVCPTAGTWYLTVGNDGNGNENENGNGNLLKHECQFSVILLPTIEVTSDKTKINVGDTTQFRAWLVGDNKRIDITNSAVWSSSVTGVATIGTGSTGGQVQGIAAGVSNICATAYGVSSPLVAFTVVQPTLTITPNTSTIFFDESQQFQAVYFDAYTTNSNVTTSAVWNSNNPLFTKITSGLFTATALSQGNILIIATFRGAIATSQIKVIVPTVELTTLKTAINVGETTQFNAWLVYPNHRDPITNSAAWSSNQTQFATIGTGTTGGLIRGIAAGVSNITATAHGVSSPVVALTVVQPTLTITPNQKTILIGDTLQCSAVYVDAYTTINDASKFEWSSNNSFVSIGKTTGLATAGLSQGQSLVTAVYRGMSGTAIINVNLPTITFVPAFVTISVGANYQLTPTYSEGYTPTISWLSSNDQFAPVGPTGIVRGLASGISTITAFDTNKPGVRGTVQIIVTAPVTPPSLPPGWGPNWKMEGPYND